MTMALLFEPEKAEDGFVVTPDYDRLMVEFAEADPDHPDPRFNDEDCFPFEFHYPESPPSPSPLEIKTGRTARR
jgi:hypothetical protein